MLKWIQHDTQQIHLNSSFIKEDETHGGVTLNFLFQGLFQ
jgi:hypothetical protein